MTRNKAGRIMQKGGLLCLVILLIASFIATPIGQSLSIQKTEAQGATSVFSVPVADLALQLQEYFLDQLVWDIGRIAISSITDSIVNWINSGFDGNPAFITDLEAYLFGIVDQVIGEFIYGSDLAFLCSPFQLEVRIALALAYYQPYGDEARCTLSDVVSNIEGFFAGAYDPRGWEGWFTIATNPHNNPYGAIFEADAELAIRIASATGESLTLLEWGDGFLSEELCIDEEDPDSCFIINPGAVIEGQLQHVLGSGIRQLELADEINEIVGALVGYLIREMLTGAGGLLGLSGGGSYAGGSFTIPTRPDGGSSYTDGIADERDAQIAETRDEVLELISSALADEAIYRSIKQQTLASIAEAREALENLRQCHENRNNTDSAEAITGRIETEIEPLEAAIQGDIDRSLILSAEMQLIQSGIQNAETAQDIQTGVGAYLEKQALLHGAGGINSANAEREQIADAMNAAAEQARRDRDRCQNPPEEDDEEPN